MLPTKFSATRRSAANSTAVRLMPKANLVIQGLKAFPVASAAAQVAVARISPSISNFTSVEAIRSGVADAPTRLASTLRTFLPIFSADWVARARGHNATECRRAAARLRCSDNGGSAARDAVKGGRVVVSLPNGKRLEVAIPAGIEEGQQIRLKGQGEPGALGGQPGDAIVTVHIGRHPQLRVDGRDLRLDLPITLYEAVLGGKVEAATLDGHVELTRSRRIRTANRTLRLRGKGLPASGGKPAGDLLVSLRIVLPEGADPELDALAATLAKREAVRSAQSRLTRSDSGAGGPDLVDEMLGDLLPPLVAQRADDRPVSALLASVEASVAIARCGSKRVR